MTKCRICEDNPHERHACKLADGLDVQHGTIVSLGKFEGEARYMPRFYGVFLDGFADEQPRDVLSVAVDAEDKAIYPELKRRQRVRFYERSDGFVCQLT